MTIVLEIPESAPPQAQDAQEKLLRAAVAMYDARLVSQGQAARIAGLSRFEFLDSLARFRVNPFQYGAEEALEDARMLAEIEEEAQNSREDHTSA